MGTLGTYKTFIDSCEFTSFGGVQSQMCWIPNFLVKFHIEQIFHKKKISPKLTKIWKEKKKDFPYFIIAYSNRYSPSMWKYPYIFVYFLVWCITKIWLNSLWENCHFGHITKSGKREKNICTSMIPQNVEKPPIFIFFDISSTQKNWKILEIFNIKFD